MRRVRVTYRARPENATQRKALLRMIETSAILFITGFLVLVSILASRVSGRLGIPALIVFLGIGMLAGSEGPGGIHFDNAKVANLVGTLALAFILFAGGLDTNWRIIRPVLGRGVTLSTLGVVITAALVGLFAWGALGFNLLTGLLLGAIISSTDAAAVFSILRGRGVGLKGNLKPLLELESGSNDPVAVFLTLSMTQALTLPGFSWMPVLPWFVWNMAGGAAVGLATGKLATLLFNRVRLDYEGLYPVLSMSVVLLTFGASEYFKCNGFLAVYLCGIILNATDFTYRRYVGKFHDGLAWLMQIIMFLALGLLVYPSRLLSVTFEALLVALFLMLVARPVAVALGLWGSSFSLRARALVAWTGLRGAAPIVLATFPLIAGYKNSDMIFNVVFFTVLTSVLVQGTLLMPVARWLKVDEPMASPPKFSMEIEHGGHMQGETREIEILPNMAAAGKTIADLDLPHDALILLIGRGDGFVVPRGQTRIEPYDTLLVLGEPAALREAGDTLLSAQASPRRPVGALEDPLSMLPSATNEKYLSKQVVVVGHGHVGRRICEALRARGIPFVVADRDRETVERLRERDVPAVYGDASTAMALAQAHVARAALLVITTPDVMKVRQMAEVAKRLNPSIEIAICSHSEMEATLLRSEHTGVVFLGEEQLAQSLTEFVLRRIRG